MNRAQSNDHNIGLYIELIKFICFLTMIKNNYFKIYVVRYHIFINLFLNHIKKCFVEYRQILLIFDLVRTAISFSFFSAIKIY